MGKFDGKVAFITGVARGQGRSHAEALAREGADIIGVDACADIPGSVTAGATLDDLNETIRIVEALDRRIVAAPADVRDLEALKAVVDLGVSEFGRLDIVAANAGILSEQVPALDISESLWNDTIDINLTGVWKTVKAAVPHMIAAGNGGSVMITNSIAGLRGYENTAHYVASKHGLVGLMRTLAREWAQHGIRVNSIHPTQVNTPMIMNESTFRLFRPDLENPTLDDFAHASQDFHLLPVPWVEAIDITNALIFLASDEARYITGISLPVDAGCLVK